MEGANNDQKLAAIITPPVKPSETSKTFLLEELIKNTHPEPKAVTIQVNNPAIKAWIIGCWSMNQNLIVSIISF